MKNNLSNIKKAKYYLDKGDCIAIPTETVYGLAGNAYSNKATLKIFKLKKRTKKNPLIVHYNSLKMLNNDCIVNARFIKLYKKLGYSLSGPLSADTAFLKDNRNKFDVIIGMYHDQVLTPIKTLFEYDAINITLGLPFIRISPDHGPNEKMLGKNLSNPLSLIKALSFLDKN